MQRYTIEFSEEFDRFLAELAKAKGLPKSEIIRRAVAYYGFLHRKAPATEGKKVSITDRQDRVLYDIELD